MNEHPTVEWKSSGRTATLVCKDGNRMVEVFVEMSGNPEYDALVWIEDLKEWNEPEGVELTKDEEDKILTAILNWEKNHKIRMDIPRSIRTRLSVGGQIQSR